MAATAVEAWDERWATPEGRADWLVPHPAVAALVPMLKPRGAQDVLDLGCGVGRHALLFAEHGFTVEAIDGATAGLDFTRCEAAARGLRLSLRQADADALPFADETFDYVLSWNVIFHGTMGDVGHRLAEIWRILKPGALYQGTMLSKRDAQFGRGRPVAPDTFIRGSDAKAHPHYYCDLAGLTALFAGFELLSLTQEEQRRTGTSSPNGSEWGRPCEARLGRAGATDQDLLRDRDAQPSSTNGRHRRTKPSNIAAALIRSRARNPG